MRKDINSTQFYNGYFNESPDRFSGIAIVTMPTCGKCKAMLARSEELDSLLPDGYSVYEFNGDQDGLAVLQEMGISSAPIAVVAYGNGRRFSQHFESLKELDDFLKSGPVSEEIQIGKQNGY